MAICMLLFILISLKHFTSAKYIVFYAAVNCTYCSNPVIIDN